MCVALAGTEWRRGQNAKLSPQRVQYLRLHLCTVHIHEIFQLFYRSGYRWKAVVSAIDE